MTKALVRLVTPGPIRPGGRRIQNFTSAEVISLACGERADLLEIVPAAKFFIAAKTKSPAHRLTSRPPLGARESDARTVVQKP